jgi:hypothetical protein
MRGSREMEEGGRGRETERDRGRGGGREGSYISSNKHGDKVLEDLWRREAAEHEGQHLPPLRF